jgi:DNA-binding CsgD family transcriptional regulator
MLRSLFAAQSLTVLQWEARDNRYIIRLLDPEGNLVDADSTIRADAPPLPILTGMQIGLLIEDPSASRHIDIALRQVLGQGPALLLPVTRGPMVIGLLALHLLGIPADGEMALALALARQAALASAGDPDSAGSQERKGRARRLPRMRDSWAEGTAALSPREREVVRLLAGGLRNKEIAAQLHITERTVKFHLGRIFDKLDVDSRTELLLRVLELDHTTGRALPNGVLAPEDEPERPDKRTSMGDREGTVERHAPEGGA